MNVYFHGEPLPANVRLLGYMVTTPKVTQRTVDVPSRRGLIRTGRKIGARLVTLKCALWADTVDDYAAAQRELMAWCYTVEPMPLVLPGHEAGELMAECTAYPAPDFDDPADSFEIEFTCARPEFIAPETELFTIGSAGWIIRGTVDTPVLMRCTVSTTLTDPAFLFDTDGHVVRIAGDLEPGALVLDTDTGTLTLDGDDITDRVTLDSDLCFTLAPGPHTVSAPAGVTGSLHWHRRWL